MGKVSAPFFCSTLLLVIIIILFDFFAKLIFGIGLSNTVDQIIQLSKVQIYYSRIVVVVIFVLSLIIWLNWRSSKLATKNQLILWAPLFTLLLLNIRITSESFSEVLRTANFSITILSCILLAATPGISKLFFKQIYLCVFLSSLIGVVLFAIGSKFSYFTDGYGFMYTGVFAHKDKASLSAALGLILGVHYYLQERKRFHFFVIILQVIALILASTLSSVFAALIGVIAIIFPRPAFIFISVNSMLLPFYHTTYSSFALILGKNSTFTGRTTLWDFTIFEGIKKPIFGHGFQHLSQTDEWSKMLEQKFKSDAFFIPHAHNLWVELFYKFGIVGIVVHIMMLVILPLYIIKYKNLTHTSAIAFSIMTAMMAKSALTLPFLTSDVSSYIWVFSISVLAVDQLSMKRV